MGPMAITTPMKPMNTATQAAAPTASAARSTAEQRATSTLSTARKASTDNWPMNTGQARWAMRYALSRKGCIKGGLPVPPLV
jgi:hypothetical protein